MTKILQRYLASSFIPPFLFSTMFFVAFLLTFQLFRIVRIVINKGVELSVIFGLVGHIAISFLPMAIPLSALFATIFTLNKLSEDSEIVAMRSFGSTKRQLFTPFLVMGLLIGASIFALNRNLIPYSKTQFKNTIIKLTSRGMLADIQPGYFFTDIPDVTLFARDVQEEGTKLHDVFIRVHKKNEEKVILAKKGALVKQTLGKLKSPSLRLHLSDGNITQTFKDSSSTEKIIFNEYDFPILSGGELPGFVTKDSMKSNAELRRIIRMEDETVARLEAKKNRTATEDRDLNEIKSGLPKSKLEYWSRLNTPIQCLIFILLGFSLGIKKGRGRSRNTGTLSLIILASYYAIFFTGVSFARKGVLPAPLVVFVPSVVATVVGIHLFRKLDWMS